MGPYGDWYASDVTVSASSPYYFADGSYLKIAPTISIGGQLDVYDNLNGSLFLEWTQISNPTDSYNVYVNGVLNQSVFNTLQATVTGLQIASYNRSTQVLTPSATYHLKVVAVYNGIEVARSQEKVITPGPTSIMLVTPMKRIYPFPSTGIG